MPPTRRETLAAVAGLAAAGRLRGQDVPRTAGLFERVHEPKNLEAPFAELADTFLTPTAKFYVRSHFAAPVVDADAFRLTVDGLVETPLSLSLADLKAMAEVSRPATLECAGNGRVFLVPPAPGAQWGLGAVGTADWAGVPLGAVLDRAKVKAGAVDVVLTGADKGPVAGPPASPGAVHFDRGIPLAKCRRDETLLAWEMNGRPLTPDHGFPLRAVVGGWYGMAAVKWLTRVTVTDRPYQGYWQTLDYSYFERAGGRPEMTPITAILPKASVARPAAGEVVAAGKPYRVIGLAWAGENAVERVEVSTDGGASWSPAAVERQTKPCCWQAWRFDWTPEAKGPAGLLARCVDAAGRGQPDKRDPDRRTYLINHLVPVPVTVG